MFRKQLKIKSSTQIKNSERKSLKATLLGKFPTLDQHQVEAVFPKKETIVSTKVVTAGGKHVMVYSVSKRAMLFCVDDVFFPTVYLLWKLPDIGVVFTTDARVLPKMQHGADLMIPGVFNRPENSTSFQPNDLAVINLLDNRAIIAVGTTVISAEEMQTTTNGKCVVVYHCFGDKLCHMDDLPLLSVPNLGAARIIVNDEPKPSTSSTSESVEKSHAEMDRLLKYCFLLAIKSSNTLQFPIRMTSLYKHEMKPVSYEHQELDVRKSSYKKISNFLDELQKDGLVVIKENEKGVEMIESVNMEHPEVKRFQVKAISKAKIGGGDAGGGSDGRTIVESYRITPAVVDIFKEAGLQKGNDVLIDDVRNHVTDYVLSRKLRDDTDENLVNLNDSVLRKVCKNKGSVTWEELIQRVTDSMKSCLKVSDGETENITIGKVQPIMLSLQRRPGNKKATIVENLQFYSIRMSEFAKQCQRGVAASTSVTRLPGQKSDQILIQGNQLEFIYNLLIENYKIPQKYIKGYEKAGKK